MIEPVKVVLDRERELVFNFGAFRALQDATGHSVLKDGIPFDKFDDVGFFLQALRAGCLRDDPTVTVEQIEQGIGMTDLERILVALTEALGRAYGTAKADPDPQTAHDPSP